MASLVIGVAGAAIGSSIGGTIAGISAATIGGMIGSTAGSLIDSYLFRPHVTGSRLTDLSLQTSTEGAAITRIDGTIRVSGQVIWATKYKETTTTTTSGGKGGGVKTTEYTYSISFAVGLCQGVVRSLGRIWADGNLLDTSQYTIRFYSGTDTQVPDTLIEEIEGSGNTPAYRGLCYVVFEDMELTDFGNRIPQLQFELVRSTTASRHEDALENLVSSVNLIPGAGEFVYASTVVVRDYGNGTTRPENQANSSGEADAVLSLDALEDACPNLKSVNLVVGWFGSDLRCSECVIKPKVEETDKDTYGEYLDDDGDTKETDYVWKVDDIKRADAEVVSYVDGYPAYGGTPSDRSVKQLIAAIKAKGWKITFYPFVFMDIASGNSLPNPYSDNAATNGQPVYPWRGRISCSPAPGYSGTVNLTSTAATQVGTFFTRAWGYNRMVEHYANLCVDAGGVDAFIIASELKGLTRVRSAATTYPAVTALKTLAATVKGIVGSSCKVGYAADWSEWNGHQTGDATGAFQFNLDPLWTDSHIDFIGIDNYMPLADWRDGVTHLDYDATDGPTTPRNKDYLQSNIEGGEDYDWYYASDEDRDSQTRTGITDATYSKPWIWRAKDLKNWWLNSHYNRVDGTQSSTATAWVPQSKPFRFTELGCPAIDKGANQPNVFYDAKSSESAYPYYSTGDRDDLIQRAFLTAHMLYWADSTNNPTSTVTSGSMIATDYTALWCWDARPFPFFPGRSDLWADAENYELGHWLNGRLGLVLLSDLVTEICEESGFTDYDVSDLEGLVTGYARTSTLSARDELESLAKAFFFDGVESQGKIKFLMRGRPDTTALSEDDLVIDPDGDTNYSFSLTRAQDDDLPKAYRITYLDASNGYEQGSYQSKRLVGNSNRVTETSLPLVMDRAQAGGVGDRLIQEAWISRETAAFSLPPSFLALDPADEVKITVGGRTRRMRLTEIDDTESRSLSAVATDPSIYESLTGTARDTSSTSTSKQTGRALLAFMDIPILQSSDVAYAPHLAAYADPWPGSVLLYRSASDSGYAVDTTLSTAAQMGETLYDFYSGPVNRWDTVNALYVKMYSGTLVSVSEEDVLNGANVLGLQNGAEWEILQFATATLTDTMTWKLTGLLRGQLGTEQAMASPLAAGARVVVLNSKIVQSAIPEAQYSTTFNYKWGPSDKDISNAAYQSDSIAFQGVGLRPYAPCHVGFAWNGGDLTFTWIRRDRSVAADGWDQTEIPLSETAESYDLEILNAAGTAVVRTVSSLTSAAATYTAAQQASDFSAGLPNPLILKLYQLSTVFGRGAAKIQSLYTR
jgi:hypothetical protein